MRIKINKVLIINPPTSSQITKEGRVIMPLSITFEPPRMPLAMSIIASSFVEQGFDVKIIDAISESLDFKKVIHQIKLFSPDLTIINCSTPTLEDDLKILHEAKKHNSQTVFFGQHTDTLFQETMEQNKELDYIFLKDPEIVSKFFAKEIRENNDLSRISGLVFRSDNQQITYAPTISLPLDTFPIPARHLLNNSLYRLPNGERYSVLLASRGCAFECSFCEAPGYHGKNIRRRSPKSIADEIAQVQAQFNINYYLFQSDLFTSNKNWVMDVCDEIIKRNLKIHWIANSRIDTMEEEMLTSMKRAGCFLLGIGVESGSEKILQLVGKNISPDQVIDAINTCKKLNIRTSCSFVVGYPGETKETLLATEVLVRKMKSDFATFMIAYPFPGSKLYKILTAPGSSTRLKENWEKNCFTGAAFVGELTEKELQRFCKKMLRIQFLKFSFVFNNTHFFKNPFKIYFLIIYLINRIPSLLSSFKITRSFKATR